MTSIPEIRARLAAAAEPYCSTDGQAMKWPGESGGCRSCDQRIASSIAATGDWMASMSRPMIVCAACGNKRCPKATWHGNACSGSNDTDQDATEPASALHRHARGDLEYLLAELDRVSARGGQGD